MITLIQVDGFSEPHQRWLYELMRERSSEEDAHVNISHRALPPYEEHVRYVETHPYAAWFLVMEDQTFVGSVSLTKRNEIGIVLLRAHRGKGIGKLAVRELMARIQPQPAKPSEVAPLYLANINPHNTQSIEMFKRLGFKPIQVTYGST